MPPGMTSTTRRPSDENASASGGSRAPRNALRGSVAAVAPSVIHVYHEGASRIGDVVRRAAPDREVVVWTRRADLVAGLADVEVLFAPMPPRDGWAGARRLRLLQLAGAGVDILLPSPDLPPYVEVAGARGVFAAEVAEHVIASLLALVRRLPELLDQQRERRWKPRARPSVVGETLVLLGVGEIGRRIARAALALDMRVVGVSRRGRPLAGVETVPVDRLAEVLPAAHTLVVATPLTPSTAHLIDAAMLRRLRPGAFLINVARGGIVDEDALAEALAAGRLGGAALDVFATEPLPADSRLWTAPGLIVSPHIAGHGERYFERCVDILVENVRRLETGEPRTHLVDRIFGY
jgi:phosphoglycerate dehydrogenase-like enzyme